MTTGPNIASPAVTRLEEPLTTRTPLPLPDGFRSLFSGQTLQVVNEMNAKQFALDAYMSARAAASYKASPMLEEVTENVGMFLEVAYEDLRARFYGNRHNTAMMVPSWVVDHLEASHPRVNVPLIEIPMRPTAPVWEAVGITTANTSVRTPQLIMGNYQACARYPCPALPEHLTAFAVIEELQRQAAEHKRRYAPPPMTSEQQDALAENVRKAISEHKADSDE